MRVPGPVRTSVSAISFFIGCDLSCVADLTERHYCIAAPSLLRPGARRPAPPRDHHQRDDAKQRGGHQVIGGRQRIAGLRDQPRRRKRGESAEDRYGYTEAERYSDGARLDWKLLRQNRRQDAAVTRLDQIEEANGEYRGGERGKGDHQPE